ncbi:SusC/RagA family TonB-linked outer membrane protein [Chitinophaga pinensis]|uniref:SusC/RagA family TonB-linked outer membrane protein n=1 Tax=Chitinophaga pinensis TaxID=79329 RepID=UPI0001A2F2F1|nr:SusC/RagA family TonB-linked outer membrane protein [Chitinophaga pinensis]
MSEKDVSLSVILRKITKKTGITIFFNNAELSSFTGVTLNVKNVPFNEVMNQLLTGRGLSWVAVNATTVTVRKGKVESSPPATPAARGADTVLDVSGKVINEKGDPVPGATVMVKNSNKGSSTDADGNFIIKQIPSNAYLTITSISFVPKLIAVRGKPYMGNIALQEYVGDLDETVIKGYYSTTKRFNTGNVTTIKAEDIEKQPVSDPLLTLQGRVPGMTITQTTGVQGGAVNVQIRGRSSINNGTQPLFIVDGVPYEPSITSPPFANYGAVGLTASTLNFLNPADIESIDVLKDADATSIYGSRGANGVILITTKKGKIGKTNINLSANTGIQKMLNKRELLSTKQYLAMRREAFKNDGEEPSVENAPDLMMWDTTRYTDWQKEMIGKTARYTDAQASISGGTPNFQYLMGGNFHRETTIFPGDFHTQRGGMHFNLSGNAFDQRLKVSFIGNYTLSNSDFPGGDFATNIYLPPNTPPPFNADGTLNWANSSWINPYSQLVSRILEAQTNNIVSNVDASFRILPGLVAKVNMGYNELRNSTFSGKLLAGVNPADLNFETAEADYTTTKVKSWISEPQISYSTMMGPGRLESVLGATILAKRMENQYVYTGGIEDDALIKNPAAATSFNVLGASSYYKYIAFFGQLGYNMNERYLLNFGFRRDGSSRFGPNRQFASFGSVGMGWIFSQEDWMRANVPFLSFGKLRGSIGITGNDQIGDYQFLDQYEFQRGLYQGTKGVRVTGLYNPDYEWEKTKKMELGLEMGFLKDRISLSVSRFYTRSSNQLSVYFLPVIVGNTTVLGNLPAVVLNRGWEVVLSTQNIKQKSFTWSTSFNISVNRNKLAAYSGPDISLKEGRSLTTVNLYKSFGVDPVTGKYLFASIEGKPVELNAPADGFQATVDPAPAFFGGMENSFTYKGLRLDIFLQFVKQKGLRGVFNNEALPGIMKNQPLEVLDRWQKEGDKALVQRYNQNQSMFFDFTTWNMNSDAAYGDASFVRCKNIALSWQLPAKWMKKMNGGAASFFVNGQNLFTITGYKGWDPETQSVVVIPPVFTLTGGFRLTL